MYNRKVLTLGTNLEQLIDYSLVLLSLIFLLFFSQVQTLLQQMQDKFQTMSDQIIGRNILKVAFKVKIQWLIK